MKTLSYYINDGADYINSYLRGERFEEETNHYVQNSITQLDSLFLPTTSPMILFRGITHDLVEGVEKGYLSTSKSEDVAAQYHDSSSRFLEIHIPRGFPVIDVIKRLPKSSEQEVILPRDMKISITEILPNDRIVCKVERQS